MFPEHLLALARALLDVAREKGLRIAAAESCSGGLIAALLTEVPGSSDVFERGFVTYSNTAKVELLGVSQSLLDQHGAVSEDVARAMAEGALAHSAADLAVAVTGIAGPGGGTPDKPIGLVQIAATRKGDRSLHEEHRFGDLGRSEIRLKSAEAALRLLQRLL